MVLFGSTEWFKLFINEVNKNEEYAKVASRYEGTITIVAEIEGLPRPICLWCDPHHGKIRDWELIHDPAEKGSVFTLTANYDIWKAICLGEQDIIKGIMGGKIKVKGNMMQLLKQTKPAIALVNVMQQLPTRFPDEVFKKEA